MAPDLPCDGDGDCMVCKAKRPSEVILCRTCVTPWHVPCLSSPPETLAAEADWSCPDCSAPAELVEAAPVAPSAGSSELIAAIRAIEADTTLSEREKARRRQKLMAGGGDEGEGSGSGGDDDEDGETAKEKEKGNDVLDILDQQFNCAFCMQLPERPVTVSSLSFSIH